MYNGRDADPPTDAKEDRVRAFILACARYSWRFQVQMAGGRIVSGVKTDSKRRSYERAQAIARAAGGSS